MAKRMVRTETVDGQPVLIDPNAIEAVVSGWVERDGERVDTAHIQLTAFQVAIRWDAFERHFKGCFEIR